MILFVKFAFARGLIRATNLRNDRNLKRKNLRDNQKQIYMQI